MFKSLVGIIRGTKRTSSFDAKEKGAEFAKEAMASVDAYLAVRGNQIGEHFLPILTQRLAIILRTEADAPERIADAEWLNYVREMNNVEELLTKEVPRKLSEHFEIAATIDLDAALNAYLAEQIQATTRRAGAEAAVLIVTELERVRSARGMPRLTFPSGTNDDSDDLAGLRTAYILADFALENMRRVIRHGLDQRVDNVRVGYLNVLRDRLCTIHDSPPHSPAVLAQGEFDVFCEQVDRACSQLIGQMHEQLAEWFAIAELAGERDSLDSDIDEQATGVGTQVKAEGESLFREAVRQAYQQDL